MMRPPSTAALASALVALAFGACTVQIAGNDRTAIIRGVVTGDGAPLNGAAVSAEGVSTTSDTTGTFHLNLKNVSDRIVIAVAANGFLPTQVLVEYRGGVFHYLTDVALVRGTALNAGAETTLALGGRMFKIKAPAGIAPDGGHLEVAALAAEAGPAGFETSEAVDQRLQSSGLFYLRAVDAAGKPAQLLNAAGGASVTFSIAIDLPQLTDTQTLKVYQLGDDGLWAPSTTSTSSGTELSAPSQGYWMAGRAYKTACVKGKLVAPTKACTGERVRIIGTDGIATQDTTGTGGEFCLEGPQGRNQQMTIGATTKQIPFSAKAASCHTNPADCTDLSTIAVADTDCPVSCTNKQLDDPAAASGCSTR